MMEGDSPKFITLDLMVPKKENPPTVSHQQETTYTDWKTPEKENCEEDDDTSTKMTTTDNVSPKQDKGLILME